MGALSAAGGESLERAEKDLDDLPRELRAGLTAELPHGFLAA